MNQSSIYTVFLTLSSRSSFSNPFLLFVSLTLSSRSSFFNPLTLSSLLTLSASRRTRMTLRPASFLRSASVQRGSDSNSANK